jgi:hypothetical protein
MQHTGYNGILNVVHFQSFEASPLSKRPGGALAAQNNGSLRGDVASRDEFIECLSVGGDENRRGRYIVYRISSIVDPAFGGKRCPVRSPEFLACRAMDFALLHPAAREVGAQPPVSSRFSSFLLYAAHQQRYSLKKELRQSARTESYIFRLRTTVCQKDHQRSGSCPRAAVAQRMW